MPFDYEVIEHEQINPKKTGGNVEVWLVQTEEVMRRSVARTLDLCFDAFAKCKKRTEWVQVWQGQCLIAVSQTCWTTGVEKSLREKGNEGLREYYDTLQSDLQDIVQLVRGKLSKAHSHRCRSHGYPRRPRTRHSESDGRCRRERSSRLLIGWRSCATTTRLTVYPQKRVSQEASSAE